MLAKRTNNSPNGPNIIWSVWRVIGSFGERRPGRRVFAKLYPAEISTKFFDCTVSIKYSGQILNRIFKIY